MSKFKTLSSKLLLVGLGILIALLVLEAGLRVHGITERENRLTVYKFDDTLGWTTKPNPRHFRSTRDYAYFNYYNPQGFPIAKQDWPKLMSNDASSIAFIGDRMTEGYYLPCEQPYPFLIDQRFPAKQVVNLGVAGYAPDQDLLAARKHLGD